MVDRPGKAWQAPDLTAFNRLALEQVRRSVMGDLAQTERGLKDNVHSSRPWVDRAPDQNEAPDQDEVRNFSRPDHHVVLKGRPPKVLAMLIAA